MHAVVAAFAMAAALALPAAAAAAPPPNDDIADATEVTGLPADASGSLVDATSEPGEPSHPGLGEQSIWFKWTAPASRAVTLGRRSCDPAVGLGAFGVAVYTGGEAGVEALTPVEQFGPESQIFRAVAGHVYWLAVAPFRGYPVEVAACVRLVPAPPNDDFADATSLDGFPVRTSPVLTGLATVEPGEPDHGGAGDDASLWFRWRSAGDGAVVMRLCNGSSARLSVYTGERLDSLTPVDTRPRAAGPCQAVIVAASAGEDYSIAVSSFSTSMPPFELLIGAELAVNAGTDPWVSYTALPGRVDDLAVRQVGEGAERALLVEARGIPAAPGCIEAGRPGLLACSIPGTGVIPIDVDLYDGSDHARLRTDAAHLDIDLGDGDDEATVLVGRGNAWVRGGRGNDALDGRSRSYGRDPPGGDYRVDPLSSSALRLDGGPGADRLAGAASADGLEGGPGADILAGGPGRDVLDGGPGGDIIDPGTGRDVAFGGAGRDRVRAGDGSLDVVRCQAGRDWARLDGADVSRACERRSLATPARAVALWAVLTEYGHNLDVLIACPPDVKRGCLADVTVRVRRGRIITRSVTVPAGGSRILGLWSLTGRDTEWVADHGLRVTVATPRPGMRPLKHTSRLVVVDNRYFGE